MQNAHHIKGYALFKKGKLQEALVLYNKAILEIPEDPDIFSHRGVLYFHLGDMQKSLADMNKSVELDPEYSYRYASRAWIKDAAGDTEGAIEDYKRAIELDPEDAISHNNLGLLEEKLGYKMQAQKRYDRADKLAKAEKDLMDAIDEMEKNGVFEEDIEPETEQSRQPVAPKETSKPESKSKVIGSVFTSKSRFKEFIRFVFNGFKLKEESTKD